MNITRLIHSRPNDTVPGPYGSMHIVTLQSLISEGLAYTRGLFRVLVL
jgi:hypothetical protein